MQIDPIYMKHVQKDLICRLMESLIHQVEQQHELLSGKNEKLVKKIRKM